MSSVLKILKESAAASGVVGIPGHKLNKPVRSRSFLNDLGIEIELEGTGLPNAGYLDGVVAPSGSMWQVKNDGSLRGGLEYVLNAPCKEEEVNLLVNGLFDVFDTRKTKLVPSNRCSIHVHYNVGGLKVNSITSIIALWTIFEEPLLRWWGDARYKNHFCLSSKDEGGSVEAWAKYLREGRLPEETGLRYTALNIVAIRKYGSLEFRGGGAVNDPLIATTWTRFLYRLCEYAKNKYPNPQQIAYDLSERGPDTILRDICGEEFEDFFREIYTCVPDFIRSCYESFYNIQPVILGFPWDAWMEKIDKAYIPNPFGSEKKPKARTALEEIEWRPAMPAPRPLFTVNNVPREEEFVNGQPVRVVGGRRYIWNPRLERYQEERVN